MDQNKKNTQIVAIGEECAVLDTFKTIKWHQIDIPQGLDHAFFSYFARI